MKKINFTFAVVVFAIPIVGCNSLGKRESVEAHAASQPRVVKKLSNPERLLLYFDQIKKLSTPELTQELDLAKSLHLSSPTDYNRVRYALVASMADTSGKNDDRALDLLQPVERNDDSELRTLAVLLASHIRDHKRLDSSVRGLQQKIDSQQQKIDDLQQKIDAIKSLERNMIQRDSTSGKQ